MRVNFDVADVLDGMARSVSGREMDSFKENIFDWLLNNESKGIEAMSETIEEMGSAVADLKEEVAALEKKVEHLEDENGDLLKDLEAVTSHGT